MSNATSELPKAPPVKLEPPKPFVAPRPGNYKHWLWGPFAGFFVTAFAFLVSQLLAGALFSLLFAALGWSTDHGNQWFDSVQGQFLAVLISEGLALLFLWLFLRHRRANWRLLGFARAPLLSDVTRAAIGFVIYFTLLMIIGGIVTHVFHLDENQKQELGFDNITGTAQKLLTFVSLVLLPPIVEETLFRGFLFTGLRKKLKLLPAILVTSLLFASPHIAESSSGPLWIAGVDTFLLSIVLCYLREKTGALWASMLVHMLKNGLAFAYLYIFASK
jgi:membrane protease YdiL (CAAX protease family)